MKKLRDWLLVIVLALGALFIFNKLIVDYPSNIISRILLGIKLVATPVLIAVVIAYITYPLTKSFMKSFKMGKRLAVSVTMIIVIGSIAALTGFVGWFLYDQIKIIFTPELLANLQGFVDRNLPFLPTVESMKDSLVGFFTSTNILTKAWGMIGIVVQALSVVILTPIFLWYVLNIEGDMTIRIKDNIPTRLHNQVMPIVYETNDILKGYFKSKILSMILLMLMFIFVYAAFGLKIQYVILFAVLIAVLDMIPYIGPTAGLLIPIVYLIALGNDGVHLMYVNSWTIDGWLAAVILFAVNIPLQFIQGNILIPMMSGKELEIHPGLILAFMLFFGAILGVWGVVLSIPLGAITIAIWDDIKDTDFFKASKSIELEEPEEELEEEK